MDLGSQIPMSLLILEAFVEKWQGYNNNKNASAISSEPEQQILVAIANLL